MNLYQVKGPDLELWCLDGSLDLAILSWKERIAKDHQILLCDVGEPESVILMASEDEIHMNEHAEMNNLRIELGHAKTERNCLAGDLDKAEKALKIANDKLDAMEGKDCP